MNEYGKYIIYLIVWALFLAVTFLLFLRSNFEMKNYYFSGRVQRITYGDKGTPEVIINNKTYVLSNPYWRINGEIE